MPRLQYARRTQPPSDLFPLIYLMATLQSINRFAFVLEQIRNLYILTYSVIVCTYLPLPIYSVVYNPVYLPRYTLSVIVLTAILTILSEWLKNLMASV